MNCSLPGSTVHGILQVRMLEMGEMGGRFKMEGLYVYLWLIHVEVWQKTEKFCKLIILQLIKKKNKNTRVGCHSLLQGIFPIQGLNPCLLYLLHWQTDSFLLAPPGKPPPTEYFAPISNRNSINFSATIRVTWGFCLGPHQRVPLFLQYDRLLSSFYCFLSHSFSSVQSLSHVRVFVTPWTAAGQVPRPSPAPGVHPN